MSHDQLKLYSVSDDPEGFLYEEERWSVAIWARDEHEARVIAIEAYPHLSDVEGLAFDEWAELYRYDDLDAKYLPNDAMVEKRTEVLRLVGYRYDDEEYCESCGLAAMRMPQYAVCSCCDQCKECGHDEECKEA